MNVAPVTVVIPTRDRAHTLLRALASVQRQTLPPAAIIVVDDGSTDGSAELARVPGVTVIAVSPPAGSGSARNHGVLAAATEYVAFLDSDDAWAPEHLETVLGAIDGRVLVSSSVRDTNGALLGVTGGSPVTLTPRRALLPDSIIVTSTVLVRRTDLVAAGLFCDLPRAQDLALWLQVLERGDGVALPDVTATYQASPARETLDAHHANLACVLQILDVNGGKAWLTPGVRDGVIARLRWDALHPALQTRRWGHVAREAGWIVAHPRGWVHLARLLRARRA